MTNERKQRIVYALALSGPIIVLCGLILIFSLQVRGDLIAGFAVALSGTALPVSAMYVDLWWRHFPAKVNAERAYGKSVLSNLTNLCVLCLSLVVDYSCANFRLLFSQKQFTFLPTSRATYSLFHVLLR